MGSGQGAAVSKHQGGEMNRQMVDAAVSVEAFSLKSDGADLTFRSVAPPFQSK
jgi:hypothetical protein